MLIGTMIVIHVATCNEQDGKLTSKGGHENNKSQWLKENTITTWTRKQILDKRKEKEETNYKETKLSDPLNRTFCCSNITLCGTKGHFDHVVLNMYPIGNWSLNHHSNRLHMFQLKM